MIRTLAALAVLSLTVFLPADASAKIGINASAGVGYQGLVGDGTYDAGIDGSFGLRLGADYKLWDFLSVGLDFDYGFLDHDNRNLDVSTYHVLAVIKGHYTISEFHLFAGLGFGYGGFTIDGVGFEETYNSFINTKVTAGVLYTVWKELQVGAYMDVYLHFGGDICSQSQGKPEDCSEQGNVLEYNHILQLGLLTQYAF